MTPTICFLLFISGIALQLKSPVKIQFKSYIRFLQLTTDWLFQTQECGVNKRQDQFFQSFILYSGDECIGAMSFVGISDLLSSASGFTSSDVGGEGKKKGPGKDFKNQAHIKMEWSWYGFDLVWLSLLLITTPEMVF